MYYFAQQCIGNLLLLSLKMFTLYLLLLGSNLIKFGGYSILVNFDIIAQYALWSRNIVNTCDRTRLPLFRITKLR